MLICGISSQFQQVRSSWDEIIDPTDGDFAGSGLHQASVVRLSYLYAAERHEIAGTIGRIDDKRLDRLRQRLVQRLQT